MGRAERKKRFAEKGWRKWFFVDWVHFAFFVIVLLLAWAYHHDHQALMEVYEDPCAYCECSLSTAVDDYLLNLTGVNDWVINSTVPLSSS